MTYYFKSLEISKKVLGEERIVVAYLYTMIGLVYSFQDNYTEALEYLTKAEAAFLKIYGEENETVKQIRVEIQEIKTKL